MTNQIELPDSIQRALKNLRLSIESQALNPDQLQLLHLFLNELSQLCNLVAPISPDICPLPCRVGSLVLPEKIIGSSSLEINPDDPKRLQALAEKSAKIFGDIRPHDCPYCIEGRRLP